MKRPPFSRASLAVFAVFALALSVRLVGLTWGLPNAERWYSYHADESFGQVVKGVVNVVGGDLNPHFFNYPSLVIYITSLVYFVASGCGLTSAPIPPAFWNTLHDIVLCGRVVSAVLGAATVLPVYGIGKTLLKGRDGYWVGLGAALLMALVPGHVQHSHFATVDVPATFFVALCLWLSARACEADKPLKWLLWAALVVGLATATKYNAIIVLVAPLCAAWTRRRDVSLLAALPSVFLLAAAGFLMGCPYAALSFKEFWGQGDQGFAYELLRHPREGSGEIFMRTGNGWVYHLLVNAPYLLTWPLLVTALVGSALSLRRKGADEDPVASQRVVGAVFLFALVYFASLGLSQVRFMRYLLPLCPVLCLGATWCLVRLVSPLYDAVQLVQKALVFALFWCVFFGMTATLRPFVSVDPRDQAAQFLARNASGSGVRVGLVGAPWFWTPPLQPRGDNVPVEASRDGHYVFAYTGFDAAKLQVEKPTYFVISQYEWMEKKRLEDPPYLSFMQALNRDYRPVGDFKNPPPAQSGTSPYVPHDFLYTNPEIVVYRRNNA